MTQSDYCLVVWILGAITHFPSYNDASKVSGYARNELIVTLFVEKLKASANNMTIPSYFQRDHTVKYRGFFLDGLLTPAVWILC